MTSTYIYISVRLAFVIATKQITINNLQAKILI